MDREALLRADWLFYIGVLLSLNKVKNVFWRQESCILTIGAPRVPAPRNQPIIQALVGALFVLGSVVIRNPKSSFLKKSPGEDFKEGKHSGGGEDKGGNG